MANREKQIRLFQRAAERRLAAAELLLEHEYHLDAVYLAGYTVECSLKALILRWTPRGEVAAMMEKLTEAGAKGHDFEYLKNLLKGQHAGEAKRDRETLGALATHLRGTYIWTTDLRYQVGKFDADRAQRFFAAVRVIRELGVRS
jgi:HEPN domain-containing protein